MELILQHGILPRPAERGFARSYLLHQRIDPSIDRSHQIYRVFPEFSPAETSHLFTAAAAASAATALSLEALKAKAARLSQVSNAQQEENNEESQNAVKEPPVPSSVAEIWSAAWAGLETDTVADEGTLQNNKKLTYTDSADSNDNSAPITTPLLWLQGLRGDSRRKLLALSLAALESAIKNNKINSSSLVIESCNSILKESTAAAAKAWLGYLPTALEQALIERENSNSGGSSDSSSSREQRQQQQQQLDTTDADSTNLGVDWYALEERTGVYCSVIRLLQSTHIMAYTDSFNSEKIEEEEENSRAPAFTAATTTSTAATSLSLRASAEASLHSSTTSRTSPFTKTSSPPPLINGWKATQAGTNSQSQLFSLASSILQDMAVRVADVVAAAYLLEAAQGTWTPSSSLSRTTISSTSSGTASDKLITNSAEINNNNTSVGSFDTSSSNGARVGSVNGSSNSSVNGSTDLLSTTSLESSWWPVFAHPRISSTRQLQRFSNRLLLSRWIDTTFHSVVAAYDDRLPLFTLSSPGGLLRIRHAPVRRAAQLSALTGLRYYVSLMLEAVDAAAPTLRVLWERATGAVAWLLTYGLGKGLGLVWKGLKIGVASASATSSGNSQSNTTTESARKRASMKGRMTQKNDEASDNTGNNTSGSSGGGSSMMVVPAS